MALSRSQYAALLYGPDEAALRRKASRGQRRRLKASAKRRGLTLSGLISDVPSPLKERSSAGIRRQAQRTVNAAYKPVEAQFGSDEARLRALDEKRRYDNDNWKNWLTSQSNTLMASGRAADTAIRASQQKIQTDLDAAWAASRESAERAGQGNIGNVSNPQQANAFDFSGERGRQNELVASERRRTEGLA